MTALVQRTLAVCILLLISVAPVAAQSETTVTLLHFTDYHSHAVPFYANGQDNTAGIARAIAYLKTYADDPNTLIFNGGDTMNLGTPAWSDKYHCVEWPWFNGIVDAMAMGNHDSDYGPDVFAQCRSQITYPILSANTLDASGQPFLTDAGAPYKVFDIGELKIGVFAIAGNDFNSLVKDAQRPVAGATYADKLTTAQQVVKTLREQEKVNAVVLIGHSLYEEDVALAQAVPGIDLIFGTHSHRQEELKQIPNTNTYIISPFQYLSFMSNVKLSFSNGTLTGVSGGLVPMSSNLPEDPAIAQQVAQLQADLQADPTYAPLFVEIGSAAVELSTTGQHTGESVLGNYVMDIFRTAGQAHLAVSTSSSFRESIPPGTILEEELRTSMPYTNKIVVFDLPGSVVQQLLNYSVSRSGSDFFSQVSGVRFVIDNGQATNIQLLRDPANPAAGYAPLNPAATYKVASTDFQGLIAGGYKDIFAQATAVNNTGLDVRTLVRDAIKANSPVRAALDGRISLPGAAPAPAIPAQLPNTGGEAPLALIIPVLALALLIGGYSLRRRV